MKMSELEALLQVTNLHKHFPITQGAVFRRRIGEIKAVDGVTFAIRQGETLGLVGESGSGKTTLGRTIIQLIRPTAGEVIYQGQVISQLPRRALRPLRKKLQIIFQDPYSYLNPRMKVGDIIAEPLEVHRIGTSRERQERIQELLNLVGMSPAYYDRYPHEFSGGQRQRIAIARALATNPEFIVCDEPISALDVSIQSRIVNLLKELQQKLNLTYFFIAHDLSMVRHISDRVAVMYLGQIVELAPRHALFAKPRHPYTGALLSAIPIPNPKQERQRKRIILRDDIPNPADPPKGCRFHTRCVYNDHDRCIRDTPPLREIVPGHYSACHYSEEIDLQ